MKYRVGVTCLIEDYLIIDVDADSQEQASNLALFNADARWDVLRTEKQFIVNDVTEVPS